MSVFATDTTDVVLDVNGYFVSQDANLMYYPTDPCRLVDTRNSAGTFGAPTMAAGESRSFPIQQGFCNLPGNARAYSLNITAVPKGPLAYLTVWPSGAPRPFVSTLNSFTGAVVANAAITPAGTGGAINIFVTDASDVVIDVNGYFAAPGASGLLFYPVEPCRVLDTRLAPGLLGGPALDRRQSRSIPLNGTPCGASYQARAYALNATVVPATTLGYLTLWPSTTSMPFVSTLNSFDGTIVSNAAIVPSGAGNSISAFATDRTDLIIDMSGYFGQ